MPSSPRQETESSNYFRLSTSESFAAERRQKSHELSVFAAVFLVRYRCQSFHCVYYNQGPGIRNIRDIKRRVHYGTLRCTGQRKQIKTARTVLGSKNISYGGQFFVLTLLFFKMFTCRRILASPHWSVDRNRVNRYRKMNKF